MKITNEAINFIDFLKKADKKVLGYFSWLMVLRLLSLAANLAIPYLIATYLDELVSFKSMESIFRFSAYFSIVIIISVVISYFDAITFVKVSNKIINNLLSYSLDYISRIKYDYISKSLDASFLTQQLTTDISVVVNFVISTVISLLCSALSLIVVTIFVFNIDTVLGSVFICSLPIYIYIYIKSKKSLYETNMNVKNDNAKLYSTINENIEQIWFIKLNNLFAFSEKRFNHIFSKYNTDLIAQTKAKYFLNTSQILVGKTVQVIIFIYGGINIVTNTLSVGSFTLLISYYNQLLANTSSLITISTAYLNFKVSWDRLKKILSTQSEKNGATILDNISYISVHDLNYKFDNRMLFSENLNYTFKKGSIYQICGNNGSGKSTLLNIICQIQQDYIGNVYFNDINTKKLDMCLIRENNISFVEQFPIIFDDSVEYNLSILKNQHTLKRFFDNNKFLNLHSGNARTLSGGEQKLLSIIRTLNTSSDVIILDEPDASLDPEIIQILTSILNDLKRNKIILLITHSKCFEDIIDDSIFI